MVPQVPPPLLLLLEWVQLTARPGQVKATKSLWTPEELAEHEELAARSRPSLGNAPDSGRWCENVHSVPAMTKPHSRSAVHDQLVPVPGLRGPGRLGFGSDSLQSLALLNP